MEPVQGAAEEAGSFEGSYKDVALGIKSFMGNMGPWSVSELTLGLRQINKIHSRDDVKDFLPGESVQDTEQIHSLRRDMLFAKAAYMVPGTQAKVAAEAQLAPADILYVHPANSKPFQPTFYIADDQERSRIVVSVRGTNHLNDVLTDILGTWTPYCSGHAHQGMLHSAHWLLLTALEVLLPLLEARPGYQLFFGGHSLGAGTCALAVHLLHNDASGRYAKLLALVPRERITCVCASCPPVLSRELATSCAGYITTLTLQHDIIARMNMANLERLRLEVIESGWWEDFATPIAQSQAVQLVTRTLKSIRDAPLLKGVDQASKAIATSREASGSAKPSMLDGAWKSATSFAAPYLSSASQLKADTSASTAPGAKSAVHAGARDKEAASSADTSYMEQAKAAGFAASWMKPAANPDAAATEASASAAPGAKSAALQAGSHDKETASSADTNYMEQAKKAAGFAASWIKPAAKPDAAASKAVSKPNTTSFWQLTAAATVAASAVANALTEASKPAPRDMPAPAAEALGEEAKHDHELIEHTIDQAAHLYSAGKLYHLQRHATAAPENEDKAQQAKRLKFAERRLVCGTPTSRFEGIAVRQTAISDHSLVTILDDIDALLVQIAMRRHQCTITAGASVPV